MKTVLLWFLKYKFVFLAIAMALLATWPLFHAGLIPTHDGEYHLIRFYEFDKILREGTLYPRWAPDLFYGYGIPLFTYIYPLPNYVASFLHLFGVSFLDSVKLNMVAATLCGAFFLYLWTKRFWGNMGGFISSLFYTFAPYHFVDIYVRGSVGEVWALGIFPAFLWSYTTYVDTKKPLYLVLASIFLGLTIFSHNILGLMFFAFAVSYMCLLILQTKQKKFFLLTSFFLLLLSLGLSSIFWIPALFETHYVTGLQIYTIQRNFPDLFQLLFPSWGTGFFDSNLGDEMSVQIGIANLLAIVLGFSTLLIFIKRKRRTVAITLLFFFLWLSVVIYLMLPVSLPVWKNIPLINYFQFPWRLLSLTILICGFFAGSIFSIKNSKIFLLILSCIVIATTYTYTHPAYYMMRNDTYYTTRSNFIDGTNSPGNSFNTIWNTAKTTRPDELFVAQNDVSISQIAKLSSTKFTADILSFNPHTQIVNISYFPGWSATLDDVPISIKERQGLISFPIPKGKRTVVLTLKETPLETFAGYLSVITVGILFSVFLFGRKISTLKAYYGKTCTG